MLRLPGDSAPTPKPTMLAPASRYARPCCGWTPTIAIKHMSGNGPRMALNHAGPRTPAGKTFTEVQPALRAA
jgi:hypothetical protein